MNILFLYVEVMPYNIPIYDELIGMGHKLYVIQIDKDKFTPYQPDFAKYNIINLSSFNSYLDFYNWCNDLHPDLVYMSECFEKWYWKFGFSLKERIPFICGSDAQWTGSLHNYIKKFCFRFTYKKVFTHINSAGLWQVDYARRIGFKRDQILTPSLCADTSLFKTVDIEKKRSAFPRQFLFLGRINKVKGIDVILNAWNLLTDKNGWTLKLVGSGPMEDEVRRRIEDKADVELLPFSDQKGLCRLLQESGCVLIPSLFEPWGLVIQEAAAAAMPMIVSKHCGATYQFAINRLNSFVINENDVQSMLIAMQKIVKFEDETLYRMGLESRRLSSRITPLDVASELLSTTC